MICQSYRNKKKKECLRILMKKKQEKNGIKDNDNDDVYGNNDSII